MRSACADFHVVWLQQRAALRQRPADIVVAVADIGRHRTMAGPGHEGWSDQPVRRLPPAFLDDGDEHFPDFARRLLDQHQRAEHLDAVAGGAGAAGDADQEQHPEHRERRPRAVVGAGVAGGGGERHDVERRRAQAVEILRRLQNIDRFKARKEIAKELNVPMIALSQLSRSVEQRGGDKRPVLSDLRESGAIEQDADIVSFIYRPEYYGFMEDESGQSNAGVGEIIVAKHRNGALDSVRLRFIGEFARFENFNSFADDSDFSGGSNSLTAKSDFEQHNVTIKSKMNSFDDNDSDFDKSYSDDVPF